MNNFALFTDVSVNPQLRIGVGGYLLVPATLLECGPDDLARREVAARIKIKSFAETSSSQLEVETLLWALEDARLELAGVTPGTLRVYTDSQTVFGLLERKARLTSAGFVAKRSGRLLANAPLYQDFYVAHETLEFQMFKVPGHSSAGSHDTVQRIFSLVDKKVRKELALLLKSPLPNVP